LCPNGKNICRAFGLDPNAKITRLSKGNKEKECLMLERIIYMSHALEVQNLHKTYSDFTLDSVSFILPAGNIMGFAGQNGAGKTTTIRCILNMAIRDGGEITIFGLDNVRDELAVKQELAAVFDESFFVETWRVREAEKIIKGFYSQWDSRRTAITSKVLDFHLTNG
jgi:ABC-2 type transport system ATP-binding protein